MTLYGHFEHPRVEPGHRLRPHVVYRIARRQRPATRRLFAPLIPGPWSLAPDLPWTNAKSSSTLDSDPQPSSFDRVVAVDAGAGRDFLLRGNQAGAGPGACARGDLHARAEGSQEHGHFRGRQRCGGRRELLKEALKHMIPQFGLRVSILLDANGANTTAAAAVRAAARHIDLKSARLWFLVARVSWPARRPALGPARVRGPGRLAPAITVGDCL